MPGSGKTVAGALLARMLAVPFMDLDHLFEERHGVSAARAIEEKGEAWFRKGEEKLLGEALKGGASIVSCGGGTLAGESSLAFAQDRGYIVYLSATVETLARRLGDASKHPLLKGEELSLALESHLLARKELYERCHATVETDRLTPAEVALAVRRAVEVAQRAEGYRCSCTPAGFRRTGFGREAFHELGPDTYPVWLCGGNGLSRLDALLNEVAAGRDCVVLVDDFVNARYDMQMRAGLGSRECRIIAVPRGEDAKRLGQLEEYLRKLLWAGADRSTTVIAIGGGSVLDSAGFAASVFMRGIPVVYVPTTLLAAVDAGIGGKTAMDLPEAKNMAGTFTQPKGVLVPLDVVWDEIVANGGHDGAAEFVKTCLLAGLGEEEIVSYAGDGALMNESRLGEAISRVAEYKMDVVTEDEKELTGHRMQLNLGHTFAHMAESASGYRLSHGQAVGWGLVVAARISVSLGIAAAGLEEMVVRLCTRFGLWPPPDIQLDETHLAGRLHDKKQRGDAICLVLLEEPGRPVLRMVDVKQARNLMLSCM